MRLGDQRGARLRIGLLRFRHHDQAFCAILRVRRAERRDAALADPRNGGQRFLYLLRVGIAAGADDDVLDAALDVDAARRDVGAIAARHPPVVEQLLGLFLVAEIAVGDRGAAEFQHALLTLAEFAARAIDDAYFVVLDR